MGKSNLINKRTIVWGSVSVGLIGIMVAANVVTKVTLRSLMNSVFKGPRPIVSEKSEEDNSIAFIQDFDSKQAAYNNGNDVTEKICEEGMILLKNENNALPLKNGAKVSVFGKNSVNLVYGGSGSAAPDSKGKRFTIFESLESAGIKYNAALREFYEDDKLSGEGRSKNPDMENSGVATLKTGEPAVSSIPSNVTSSYDEYGDAALVVFSRIAGENWDLPRKASDDPNRHYLELDNNERDLLKHIVDSGKFEHIVILLNGSNYIDLGFLKFSDDPAYSNKIDACINIGSPGAAGIMALGKILTGEVNPSGHTVDLVYTNYKNDPTWQNFGGNFVDEGDKYQDAPYYFVEYEENIYMGYRYYETRGKVEAEKGNADWYDKNVVYPFGYGLSYTTFSQEVKNFGGDKLEPGSTFDVKIEVTNTGEVAGKQVVQLYAEAPYKDGEIEKSYKVLVGFAKTGLLEKGASETVTIEVDPYYFASFDAHDANKNGFKGYELDGGEYVFHCATDSHTDFGTFTKTLDAGYKFEKDPVTQKEVVPLFDDVSNHFADGAKSTKMSRKDFDGTFPTTVTSEDLILDDSTWDKLESYATTNPIKADKLEMPTTGADNEIKFKELAKLAYDDPKWDEFLDKLTFEELLTLFNEGCYCTTSIVRDDEVLIPGTDSADGPTGLVSFLGNVLPGATPNVYGCCYYCSECLVAQTYNLELAELEANAIGNEALIGNEAGEGTAYPGWYAPGVNLHRSPFSGRNTEYYSEDPFLCGKFAATVIKGVQEKGVYANVKHFALNDQETHRSANGIATWCDEQAIRELYLRSFEIAIKEGKSKGLMTSFNRIGTTWAGGDYRLCTTILREEWGFVGSVICDFHTSAYMDSKQMLYAGGDINLCSESTCKLKEGKKGNTVSPDNAADVTLLRNAAHNLLYCIVNSNAMKAEIIGYKMATWEVVVNASTAVMIAGIVGWGAWAIVSSLVKKETGSGIAG